MNPPVEVSVSPSQIQLSWTAITTDVQTGRDPAIYYSLEYYHRPCYDDWLTTCGLNTYTDVGGLWIEITTPGGSMVTSFAHQTSFYPNTLISYRLRA
jgi:hypothetical protein